MVEAVLKDVSKFQGNGEMATYKYYASIVGKFHVVTLVSLQAIWAFLGRFSGTLPTTRHEVDDC